ncbi:Uncharacterized protein Adt_42594 [Abeliophyllum distichum]|uniref:Uncharacterized protein n=1 Tax=Abeliophyllum distichum TaxID=126358 RepID=A0ABD1PS40_9LAMI
MSSKNDDSQNQSDACTNPSIRGESPSSTSSSSSSEVVGEVNQAPSVTRPSTSSTSGKGPRRLTRIAAGELEDMRLSYDISASVILRAPSPEECADDTPEGLVAIYEPTMQQGLHLPMHHFFREVLRDWNLAPFQITLNG